MHEQPVVACNYVTRDGSNKFTALREDGNLMISGRVETRPIQGGALDD